MLSQRIFYSLDNAKLEWCKSGNNTANSALFPRYLNTRGTAKTIVYDNTDHASIWHYATYNPGSIHEELCCYLECYDIEFVKRMAVTTGNLYQAILGEHYPPYCYGQVIVNQASQFFARLSADIPKAYSLVDTFTRLITVNQDGTIDLSGLKKLKGLMAAYALCVYFSDTDYDNSNLLSTENRIVKIDPECAFSDEFFTDTAKDIESQISECTMFSDDFFMGYHHQVESGLFAAMQSFNIKFDEQSRKIIDNCLVELLQSSNAKMEFYQTLRSAVDKTEQLTKILKAQLSPLYDAQVASLTVALVERQQKFAFVLNKLAIYEYPIDVHAQDSVTQQKFHAEPQDFIAKAKKYELAHRIDAATHVLVFAISSAINEEVGEDGRTELVASYYIALAKMYLSTNRLHEAFKILTATIMGSAGNTHYYLAATDTQLAWCYRQRAELYGLIGDRVNEKKDLISRFNCFKITASQKPIPYQGDRAILAKFMFHQPTSQPTQEVAQNQQSSLKHEM